MPSRTAMARESRMKTPMRYLAATTCKVGSNDPGSSAKSAPKSTGVADEAVDVAPTATDGVLATGGALSSRLV